MRPAKEEISQWFRSLQDDICQGLEVLDGKGKFHQDLWQRDKGGGGKTRIIEGRLIEKGGVNYSAVYGQMPEKITKALRLEPDTFYATGVSLVLHPHSPLVPIIHMNVRYFEMGNGSWWFGGGIDLTPHYVNEEEARQFHQALKSICDLHDPAYYPEFKKWADDYFYIKHRKETRGIGGIFFDRLSRTDGFSKTDRFNFVKSVGEGLIPVYRNVVMPKKDIPYGDEEKRWQLLRRGRYVEFNLVWDKGTKFGLDTDGRAESILMSLPPVANWIYAYTPVPNSNETATIRLLKKGIDWA